MTSDSRGRELFIVDNSVSGWTGLRYLQEWSSISWHHEKIILEPFNPDFDPLVFTSAGEDELQVIAELIEVMEG